jgi:hypothetical protein
MVLGVSLIARGAESQWSCVFPGRLGREGAQCQSQGRGGFEIQPRPVKRGATRETHLSDWFDFSLKFRNDPPMSRALAAWTPKSPARNPVSASKKVHHPAGMSGNPKSPAMG